jgi:hypothetical protein
MDGHPAVPARRAADRTPPIGRLAATTTSFWGTSDTGTWTGLASSSWAPARLDRRRAFRETFLRLSPLDPVVDLRTRRSAAVGNQWLLSSRKA